jgi:hypothetical protein
MAFDLVGLSVREQRGKMKVTLLTRTLEHAKWTNEGSTLMNGLKPMCVINTHPQHPTIMMLLGTWPEDEIRMLLPGIKFTVKVVQGYDNPELPWSPQI